MSNKIALNENILTLIHDELFELELINEGNVAQHIKSKTSNPAVKVIFRG